MAFVGIDAVVYGATDMGEARRMFLDWGLKKKSDTRAGLVFATELGAEVVVRPAGAAGLRPPIAETSQFREVIYGVSSRTHLAAIDRELSRDREVLRDKDGTLHSVDDSGVNIGFRVWRHGSEKPSGGTRWNGPGNRGRVNQVARRYTQASPYKIGHIVFFVPDVRVAERFYRKRLGFFLSDRYAGGAASYLRWARKSEHHNLFLARSKTGKVDLNHVAFEVHDLHEVFGGGREFARRGWPIFVGPGRHPISSAYFWYFKNPLGGNIEYFCDPDQVTDAWKPTNYRLNRFSEWHLVDGLKQVDDGIVRSSLASAKAIEKALAAKRSAAKQNRQPAGKRA
jgi:catechol 2,3-dioxygenase-like lactoylglutathione lyase family enzyme